MHSAGANIAVLVAKINTPYLKETFTMQVTHLSYFPRVLLTSSDNASLSVGTPVGIGINLVRDVSGDAGVAWGYELPVVADYNIGCKATPDNDRSFGGYFGAGFSYLYVAYNMGAGSGNVKTYGPMGRAGVRFGSGDGRWNTTVGLYYKAGLEADKFKTVGFNVLMDF